MNPATVRAASAPVHRKSALTRTQARAIADLDDLIEAAKRLGDDAWKAEHHRKGSPESAFLNYLAQVLPAARIIYLEAKAAGVPLRVEPGVFAERTATLVAGELAPNNLIRVNFRRAR
jgi:hypothetical protein